MRESRQQKTALITGANGGIGRALVETFRGAGYRVIGTDREAMADHCDCDDFLVADVRTTVEDPAYRRRTFDELRRRVEDRGLDALINNAAAQILGSVEELKVEDWTATLNTNLLAPFLWTQALLPQLRAAQGSVVNVSSIHAHLSKPGFVAYATSKAALSAMTRNMALELGSEVRINAIEPAAVKTDMLVEGFGGREDRFHELNRLHPIGRIAEPEEVARVAVFLCSEAAGFLQGSVVSATGGIHGRLTDPD